MSASSNARNAPHPSRQVARQGLRLQTQWAGDLDGVVRANRVDTGRRRSSVTHTLTTVYHGPEAPMKPHPERFTITFDPNKRHR